MSGGATATTDAGSGLTFAELSGLAHRAYHFPDVGLPALSPIEVAFLRGAWAAISDRERGVRALVDAAMQVLDDMGPDRGTSCCLAAKAELRIAVEPWRSEEAPVDMPLADALAVMKEVSCG